MSDGPKYEVVSVDVSNVPETTQIEWLAICSQTDKLCPYLSLRGPIYDRLSGYHLMRKDLQFAENALNQLREQEQIGAKPLIMQSLWFAAIVAYAKCFTSAKGRKIKLEDKDVFKGVTKALSDTHKEMLHQRHEYISHAGTTPYEASHTMLALDPDLRNKRIFGLYHSMHFAWAISGRTIGAYIGLVQHVKDHIESVLDKLFPGARKEIRKTNVEGWYRNATYPMEGIASRSRQANLTAPGGGVLKKIFIRVEIEPETGGMLIYGAPHYNSPKRFNGPTAEGAIETTEPKIHFQKLNNAERIKIYTLGFESDR